MRGGGISPTPEEKVYLYNKGTLNVPFTTDNTTYTESTSTVYAPVFNTNNIYLAVNDTAGIAITGTVNKIDLSQYSLLVAHAKAHGVNNRLAVSTGRNVATSVATKYIMFSDSDQYAEYAIDVSDLSGEYYISLAGLNSGKNVYIDEVYLVPKQRKYIIKDGVLQDGFSLSSTTYSRTGYDSTGYSTITYNDGYIRLYSTFGGTWQTSCTVFLDNNLSSVTSGTILYVEAITSFANFDTRYPSSAGQVKFSQVSGKVNKYSVYASSNQIINNPDQKTIYSTQCTNTSKYFAFPEMQIDSYSSSVTATLTIDIYNAWFY